MSQRKSLKGSRVWFRVEVYRLKMSEGLAVILAWGVRPNLEYNSHELRISSIFSCVELTDIPVKSVRHSTTFNVKIWFFIVSAWFSEEINTKMIGKVVWKVKWCIVSHHYRDLFWMHFFWKPRRNNVSYFEVEWRTSAHTFLPGFLSILHRKKEIRSS